MSADHPTCFVSYSHDTPEHKNAVVALVQALRGFGIDAQFDQFVQHDPPQHWPSWMVEQIEESDYVLVVVTETYARRFKGKEEPGVGKGATWEGAIISGSIYDNFGGPVKFIPIILSDDARNSIPFPLSQTNHHLIEGLQLDDLNLLIHQLRKAPLLAPAPLGSALDLTVTTGERPIAGALRVADDSLDDGIERLNELSATTDPEISALAAFHLGELYYKDEQYNKAVEAFQFALERGPKTSAYEDAKREIVNVFTYLNNHYGESSALAAAREFIDLLQHESIEEAWRRIDQDARLAIAQDWILHNEDHPNLRNRDRNELARSLASLSSTDPLFQNFLGCQLRNLQGAYGEVDLDDWGAPEKSRTYKIEYEMVILMPTNGEVLVWQTDMNTVAVALIMRRRLQKWHFAGYDDQILKPGWPPTFEKFTVDGVGFESRN